MRTVFARAPGVSNHRGKAEITEEGIGSRQSKPAHLCLEPPVSLCVLGLSSVVQNPPAPAVPSQRPPHLIHPTRCRRRPPATPPSATPGNAVAPPLHTGPSR